MSGAYRELKVSTRVLRVLQGYSEDEQDEVLRLLGIIRMDPVPDGQVKHVLRVPPVVFTVYATPRFWIAYHVVGNVVNVNNVGRAHESRPHMGS